MAGVGGGFAEGTAVVEEARYEKGGRNGGHASSHPRRGREMDEVDGGFIRLQCREASA